MPSLKTYIEEFLEHSVIHEKGEDPQLENEDELGHRLWTATGHRLLMYKKATVAFDRIMESYAKRPSMNDRFVGLDFQESIFDQLAKLKLEWDADEVEGDLVDYLDGLVLGYSAEWNVYFPIVNLELSGIDELSMGPVIIRRDPKQKQPEYLSDTYSAVESYYGIDKKSIDAEEKGLYEARHEKFWTGCVAKSTVTDRCLDAKYHAENQVRRALQILRLYVHEFEIDESLWLFGLRDEVTTKFKYTWATCVGKDYYNFERRLSGYKRPFVLDQNGLSMMRTFRFDEFVKIQFEEVGDCELGKAVRRAIFWFSEGVLSSNTAARFAYYMMVIESVFGEQGDNLTHKLAERIAMTFRATAAERLAVYHNMKKLYGKRSNVVHRGLHDISYDDLRQLREYAFYALLSTAIAVVDQGITKSDEFFERILEIQFAGP